MATFISHISQPFHPEYQVVFLDREEAFFVKHMVPNDIGDIADVERTDNGSRRVTARTDLIAVVEGLHGSRRGCKHIRFLRANRWTDTSAEGLGFAKPQVWPRLRVAMIHSGRVPHHAQGGFENALTYSDEMAIANYSTTGSKGWIILRKDIGKYLDALPPVVDSGELDRLWISSVGFLNTPDECCVRITQHDPSNEPPPEYYDVARGCHMSSNHQIFLVEFDKGSRLVKKITSLISGRECDMVGYQTHPTPRYVVRGKRLPRID